MRARTPRGRGRFEEVDPERVVRRSVLGHTCVKTKDLRYGEPLLTRSRHKRYTSSGLSPDIAQTGLGGGGG